MNQGAASCEVWCDVCVCVCVCVREPHYSRRGSETSCCLIAVSHLLILLPQLSMTLKRVFEEQDSKIACVEHVQQRLR